MTDNPNWIDLTSLAVLLVFFVLGLFRGFLWQISRFASLVLAWVLSDRLHDDLAGWLDRHGILEGKDYLPYLSFFVIFIVVLVGLSLLTILIEKLVRKLHMGFYDRLGGGFVGIATGGALLVAVVGLVFAFPDTKLAMEVEASRTGRVTKQTVALLEAVLSPRILTLYGVPGYEVRAQGLDGDPTSRPASRPDGAGDVGSPFQDGTGSMPASREGGDAGQRPGPGADGHEAGGAPEHAPVPPIDPPTEPPIEPRREPDRR
ncbi:MAG: CvpA family protein [Planctomycetota bacterium]